MASLQVKLLGSQFERLEIRNIFMAQRGKRLRFVGQLGLSGEPVQLLCTYDYEAHESGTKLKLTCHAFGVLDPGWSKAVDATWHHFLVERLHRYIPSGSHKKRGK